MKSRKKHPSSRFWGRETLGDSIIVNHRSWSREGQRRRLKRWWDKPYVRYNHSISDALTIDECLPQAHCFNSRLQPRRFRDRWANPIIVTEGDWEALGNRVQLRAAVCGCLTQQAQIPANVVSCWRAPTCWVPAINKGKTKKCAECAHNALIARYALATDV